METALPHGPFHLNVAFEDPLRATTVTYAAPVSSLDELAARSTRPLVVVGGLRASERERVVELLTTFQAPVWLETTSGLRGDARLESLALKSGSERFYRETADGLLRVGAVPTTSLWREADGVFASRPVLSLADAPWSGCARPEATPRSLRGAEPVPSHWNDSARATFLDEDSRRAKQVVETLHAFPRSEQALVHFLSGRIPASDGIYLGNSLAIRHWDRFASRRAWRHVDANRGANGIDGQLSTFFGSAPTDRPAWAVVGDLTTLYDLSAPWFARPQATAPRRVVVLNNGGGQIFRELFLDDRLRSAHDVGFAPWARLWRWEHHRVESPSMPLAFAGRAVIEVVPDPAQTEAVSRRLLTEVDVP
jgi:2-succinyl-5-enolpyruvyl-6-hydroxy-3-cyclohexene-1-carboxylate synthase